MSANYLEHKYLLEKIEYIDEGFTEWARRLNVKTLLGSMKNVVNQKDEQALKSMLSKLPKVEFQKLFTIGNQLTPSFEKSYEVMKRSLSKNKNLKGRQLDYLSLSLATLIVNDADKDKAANNLTDKIFKKASGGGSIAVGGLLMLISGAFVAAALSTFSMIPLLIALGIVGLGMAVAMG
jgi:hypothetical protein